MRYIGDGTQIPGVPPRDLSEAEADQFGPLIADVDAARVAGGMAPLYEGRAPRGGRRRAPAAQPDLGPSEFKADPEPNPIPDPPAAETGEEEA